MTKLDFPLPLTPVTAVRQRRGIRVLNPFRLLIRASSTSIQSFACGARAALGSCALHCETAGRTLAPAISSHVPGDHLATELTSGWAHVDHMVRRLYDVGVVLNHDEGVSEVSQTCERAEQSLSVALMQPNCWLIQDVDGPCEPCAELGSESDSLSLAPAQRIGRPTEREVVEADVAQEAQLACMSSRAWRRWSGRVRSA